MNLSNRLLWVCIGSVCASIGMIGAHYQRDNNRLLRPAKVTYYGGHGAMYAECPHDELTVTPSYKEMEQALGDQSGTIAWNDYRDTHTLCMKEGDYSAR
jgi:hypothetical protein